MQVAVDNPAGLSQALDTLQYESERDKRTQELQANLATREAFTFWTTVAGAGAATAIFGLMAEFFARRSASRAAQRSK